MTSRRPALRSTIFPCSTLFRSIFDAGMKSKAQSAISPVIEAYDFSIFGTIGDIGGGLGHLLKAAADVTNRAEDGEIVRLDEDRKSTRLNSSHVSISYADFCL